MVHVRVSIENRTFVIPETKNESLVVGLLKKKQNKKRPKESDCKGLKKLTKNSPSSRKLTILMDLKTFSAHKLHRMRHKNLAFKCHLVRKR